jgi:hypothetical protein
MFYEFITIDIFWLISENIDFQDNINRVQYGEEKYTLKLSIRYNISAMSQL